MLLFLIKQGLGKQKSLPWVRNTYMHQKSADHHTKDDGPKKELSILQDNLDDQVQKKYQDVCQ